MKNGKRSVGIGLTMVLLITQAGFAVMPAAAQENTYTKLDGYISDGDFNDGAEGWTFSNAERSADAGVGSTGALYFSDQTGSASYTLSDGLSADGGAKLKPDTAYELRGVMRLSDYQNNAEISVTSSKEGGTFKAKLLNAGTDYTAFTYCFTTSSDTSSVLTLELKREDKAGASSGIYVDDLALYEGGPGFNSEGWDASPMPRVDTENYSNIARNQISFTSKGDNASSTIKAVDGLMTSTWAGASKNKPNWYALDFGKPTKIVGSIINVKTFKNITYKYTIEYSNDKENWTTIVDKSENGTTLRLSSALEDVYEINARYLRFSCVDVSNNTKLEIKEFSVYGEPTGYDRDHPDGPTDPTETTPSETNPSETNPSGGGSETTGTTASGNEPSLPSTGVTVAIGSAVLLGASAAAALYISKKKRK